MITAARSDEIAVGSKPILAKRSFSAGSPTILLSSVLLRGLML
jgi:hypothetical protein